VADNAAAADLPALGSDVMARIGEIYDTFAREHVHQRW